MDGWGEIWSVGGSGYSLDTGKLEYGDIYRSPSY